MQHQRDVVNGAQGSEKPVQVVVDHLEAVPVRSTGCRQFLGVTMADEIGDDDPSVL